MTWIGRPSSSSSAGASPSLPNWFVLGFPTREKIFEAVRVGGAGREEVGFFGDVLGEIEEKILALFAVLLGDELPVVGADAAPGVFATALSPEEGSGNVGLVFTEVGDEVDAVELCGRC